jgi:hypothetical protein
MEVTLELHDGVPETMLTEEDPPNQALRFQAAEVPLQMSIQIGRAGPKPNRFHVGPRRVYRAASADHLGRRRDAPGTGGLLAVAGDGTLGPQCADDVNTFLKR